MSFNWKGQISGNDIEELNVALLVIIDPNKKYKYSHFSQH